MCLTALMPKPKMPEMKDPKLPRQPIREQKASRFKSQEDQSGMGFGQTGRSGGRGLRIRKVSPRKSFGFGNLGGHNDTGPITIGAQVPR